MTTIRNYRIAVIAVICLSCGGGSIQPLSRVFSLVLNGKITSNTGAPIPGADVAIVTLQKAGILRDTVGGCVGLRSQIEHAISNTEGSFTASLSAGGVPQNVCVDLSASPPDNSSLKSAHVSLDSLVIGPSGIGSGSVTVNIVLPQ